MFCQSEANQTTFAHSMNMLTVLVLTEALAVFIHCNSF